MRLHSFPKHFYLVIGLILSTNLLMLAGTWLFHSYYYNIIEGNWEQGSNIKHVLLELSLGTENTIATWYSSMLFMGVALLSLLNFLLQKKISSQARNRFLSYGWLIFFLLFLLLSFDEIASMHERIGELDGLNPFKDKTYGWISILAFPILAVGIYMLYFLYEKTRHSRPVSYLAFIGILLFLSVPIHEFIELRAWNAAPDMDTWKRPAHFLILEEGSELFGVSALFIAVLFYGIKTISRTNSFSFVPPIAGKVDLKRKNFLVCIAIFSSFLLFIMILLIQSETLAAEGDIGRIRNWFPAAAAMLSFLLYLYLYSYKKVPSQVNQKLSLISACFLLFLSAFYGGNLYVHFAYLEGSFIKILLMILFCLLTIGFGLLQFRNFKKFSTKAGAILWTILISISPIASYRYAAGFTFIGLSVLMISLIDHYFSSRIITSNREKNRMAGI